LDHIHLPGKLLLLHFSYHLEMRQPEVLVDSSADQASASRTEVDQLLLRDCALCLLVIRFLFIKLAVLGRIVSGRISSDDHQLLIRQIPEDLKLKI
jgi:hypothetical protein